MIGANQGGSNDQGAVHFFTKEDEFWLYDETIDSTFAGLSLDNDDEFGSSVALSGNATVLAIGAPWNSAENRGGVRLFTKTNNVWSYDTKITNNTHNLFIGARSLFGSDVALSNNGEVLAVGARNTNNGATGETREQSIYLQEVVPPGRTVSL